MERIKIIKVLIDPINVALDEPFRIAIGTKYSIENALVTIVLSNGIEGYGEAAPLEPINGENQATVLATLNSCRDFLTGNDISEYSAMAKKLKSVFWAQVTARCAIEMALLDAYTKCLDIPFYKFLGGSDNKVETDYTIDIVAPDIARINAAKLSGKGYRILKTKVGKNLTDDIDRILAIRDGAPGCGITLDANQGYSPVEAVHFLRELEKNNIHPVLFEQPVIKTDLAGMRFVKDHSFVPIAADESVFTSADAINIVRTGCADVINIKIMKSGILEAIEIATIARAANIKLMIGCMLETKLGLGCSVSLVAGLGCFSYVDLDPHIDPENEPFTGGPDYSAPYYTIPEDVSGLGIRRRQ
ncbi:MAG: dipeptide epimerase [Bacteroidales bacterium]|nr:dipeptide epimerase [Bacteroidales bacterium]MBK8884893.1 dipeptide epimerase [Bacteroidales bacterium]